MVCDSCKSHQEYLLESGDGSQVICEHLQIDEETEGSNSLILPSSSASSSSTSDVVEQSSTSVMSKGVNISRKRKFLSGDRFAKLASTKLRRKISPIKKWRELGVRRSHRVVQIHQIECKIIKGTTIEEKTSFYAELETEDAEMVNVWLTDIINNELSNYDLKKGNVYIMSLGKATSQSTGREYNDFVIVEDN